ncbi:MAG: SPASM domain-containing protein, partial [Nanoarchaeota archaeon]|nr:SPASM domain-containing protein [Nanoarchaeota archaeon]
IGEFIRRLSNQETEKGVYDSSFISQNPCYVGWLFSRIMASGDVIPCLKAHKFSLGNINKKSFKNIWYSKKYEEFRNKSILSAKQDKFFKNMGNDKYGCYKTCDNIWQNEAMNDIILNTKYKIATSNLYNLNLYKNQE